ncbi:MAG: phosphatidate cytidylyltransferase [Marinilabiliales bacterium]|nr:MAG: phosphatidate cytidylyltransferase [Marinilabiliales bacterium]
MIIRIYIIILIYFILGGLGFYFINRRRDKEEARYNRVKYITYFFIINTIFFSIVVRPVLFNYLGIVILAAGFGELTRLFIRSGFRNRGFFTVFLVIYLIFCTGFYRFSLMEQGLVLFTFLVISIFDAFSQISGQLFGRTKIMPSVSPRKTVEGLAGGAVIAVASSLLLSPLLNQGLSGPGPVLLSAGIVFFAFLGDLTVSLFKRRYKVKDFSNLLPGHGGFLDRFDSFIAGGAFVAATVLVMGY